MGKHSGGGDNPSGNTPSTKTTGDASGGTSSNSLPSTAPKGGSSGAASKGGAGAAGAAGHFTLVGKGGKPVKSDRGGKAGGKSDRGGPSGPSDFANLRRMWMREKRCLRCGSENHFAADCNVRPSTKGQQPPQSSGRCDGRAGNSKPGKTSSNAGKASSSSSGKAKSGSAQPASGEQRKNLGSSAPAKKGSGFNRSGGSQTGSGPSTGAKRSHDQSTTGMTPPAKKPNKRHSYAEAAKDSSELVIVTNDEGHISAKDFNKVNQAVEEAWLACLDKNTKPFHVEKWLYSNHYASVWVMDTESGKAVHEVVKSLGFNLIEKSQLLKVRKPPTILSGLLKGPAAKRDRDVLQRFLQFEKQRSHIPGRLDFYQAVDTPAGNKILRIVVDEDTMVRLAELDFELCIGASGRVKFADERANKTSSTQSRKVKLAMLEKETKELKERLVKMTQERLELQKAETESVGSVGISTMEITDAEVQDLAAAANEAKASDFD